MGVSSLACVRDEVGGFVFWGDLTPKDVRGRRREVVFDLQSLFQCASFPERIRRGGFFSDGWQRMEC